MEGPVLRCCTIKEHGKDFVEQKFYECYDCEMTLEKGMGLCRECRMLCHGGHDVSYLGKIKAYCDCATKACGYLKGVQYLPKEVQSVEDSEEEGEEEDYLDERLSVKYGEQDYWKARYIEELETGEHHEWALEFEELYPTMGPLLKAGERMLVLGCGNSTFSSKLYDSGYKKITNIDSIEEVIEYMKELHQPTRPEMEWVTMDATKLSFPDNHFDVVFDKTLLDCLMCATDYEDKITAFFKEAKRVAKTGALYISVTINPKVEDVALLVKEHLSEPKIVQITGKEGHLFHFLQVTINK